MAGRAGPEMHFGRRGSSRRKDVMQSSARKGLARGKPGKPADGADSVMADQPAHRGES